ncbi:MAG TPA: biotin/lipoyl-containing protein [Ktedonobacteraceae bacterium]
MKEIKASKAGLVVEFLVHPGETVVVNQDVVMLESMKMHLPVQASAGGIVKTVRVKAGDVVMHGDVLLELE